MGFLELFEIGFFTAFFVPTNLYLTVPVYLCVIAGYLIQAVLIKKAKRWIWRNSLLCICLLGAVGCECVWHFITGWDRLAVDILYGFCLCLLLGAVLAKIVARIKRKKSKE